MSGWIKIEKDLESDPRVRRMAKILSERFELMTADASGNQVFSNCNAYALPAVTLVCGGLSRIWILADSHAREDDTLDMSATEIDEHVGIPGFCELLPECWLRIVDEKTVELPNFHAHNGVEAKKRALTQKRVARHRDKEKHITVTSSNASALPDQDQTKTRPSKNGADAPPSRRLVSRETLSDDWFLKFKLAYPERSGDQGWRKAQRAASARLAEGHSADEIIAGAIRYAAYCAATEKLGTEFVKQAATFLGPDKPFLLPWNSPKQSDKGGNERGLPRFNPDQTN